MKHLNTNTCCETNKNATGDTSRNFQKNNHNNEIIDKYFRNRVISITAKNTVLSQVQSFIGGLVSKTVSEILYNNPIGIVDKKEFIESTGRESIKNLPTSIITLSLFATQLIVRKGVNFKNWNELFDALPALKKSIAIYISHLTDSYNLVIHRIFSDHHEFSKIMKSDCILKGIKIDAGDFHSKGDTVAIIEFINDSVVYKSRSARNESFMQSLIMCAGDEFSSAIKIPINIDKKTYSWHQYIKFKNVSNEDECIHYYKNAGHLLSILLFVKGVDFHFENIICVGGVIYLIDLECISIGTYKFESDIYNILDSNLIPALSGSELDKYICGIGMQDQGLLTTHKKFYEMDDEFTVRLKGVPTPIGNDKNRPNGFDYLMESGILAEVLSSSFSSKIPELLDNERFIDFIKKNVFLLDECRVLFRSSKFYAELMFLSSHPSICCDADKRKTYIENALSDERIPVEIIESEREQLLEFKVPYFKMSWMDNVITTADNNKKIVSNYTSCDEYHKHLDLIRDCNYILYQKCLLDLSLDSMCKKDHARNPFMFDNFSAFKESVLNNMYPINGNYLSPNLIINDGDVKFFQHYHVDLYNGISGLLILQLCEYIEKSSTQNERSLYDLLSRLQTIYTSTSNFRYGAYDGAASILYIYYCLQKYKKNNFEDEFVEVLSKITNIINKSRTVSVDVMSGISGVLIICANMYSITSNCYILNAMSSLTEILISKIKVNDDGTVCWEGGSIGFAHGNAGIIYALSLAKEYISIHEVDDIILKAIKYEDKFKCASGWVHSRESHSNGVDPNSWCRGASGIHMSRSVILKNHKCNKDVKEALKLDIEHYEKTKVNRKDNSNRTLCHGIYGNRIIENKKSDDCYSVDFTFYLFDRSLFTGSMGGYYCHKLVNKTEFEFPNVMLLN